MGNEIDKAPVSLACKEKLFFLFFVKGVLAFARAKFFDVEFFASRLPTQNVVIRAAFRAHEENRFCFLLVFGHFQVSKEYSRVSLR